MAIAASTGGPAAVETVLRDLHGLPVAVLLVQHIDQRLVGGFAVVVGEDHGLAGGVAAEGAPPPVGVVTIGPGGRHLEVDARGLVRCRPSRGRCTCRRPTASSRRSPPMPRTGSSPPCSPAWAPTAPPASSPSAQAGAHTIAQDEASSAVFGMARAALALGAVSTLTPLAAIGPAIARAMRPGIVRSRVG